MDNNILAFKRQPLPTPREFFEACARELREPQILLAELIDQAIVEKRPLAAEAGTGVGKTLAVLVPPVFRRRRVLYITHTKALQGQLLHKDLPWLADMTATKYGMTIRYAVLKGAGNYLCVRRFNEETGGLFGDGLIPPAVATWGRETQTGDMDDAPPMEGQTRQRLAVNLDDCQKKDCPYYTSCLLVKAQQRLAAADVGVLNHAYFALAINNDFLWEKLDPDVIVIDEAHHFESSVRDSHAGHFRPTNIKRILDSLEKQVMSLAKGSEDDVLAYAEARSAFRMAAARLFEYYKKTDNPEGRDLATKDAMPVNLQRVRTVGADAEKALHKFSAVVAGHLDPEDIAHQRILRYLEGLGQFFQALTVPGAIAVARRELKPDGKPLITLETYPLSVAPFLERMNREHTVIYVSATLTATGEFGTLKDALGLPESTLTGNFGSPFDYPNQAVLFVRHSQGRAFILFTAIETMRKKFGFLKGRLGYPARMQEPGQSNQALIEWFKATPNAVLFGTASFWEGVSIEGGDLSLVVIDKVPFPQMGDPLNIAKRQALGRDAFARFDLPQAIVKLKQGFGRLIRTSDDRGMVAILDPKFGAAKYRSFIIKCLPPARLITNLDDRALVESYFGTGPKINLPMVAGEQPNRFARLQAQAEAQQNQPQAQVQRGRELIDDLWPES
jgi:ATP-dependent DNA helicase DinG